MVELKRAIPILRIFDEALAREFYCDFLGFEVEFEHRFEKGMPLYMGLRHGAIRLHLSGHFGDATPGSRVYVEASDVTGYAKSLEAKKYKHARPGLPCPTAWGKVELTITDPFGNRLTFAEDQSA